MLKTAGHFQWRSQRFSKQTPNFVHNLTPFSLDSLSILIIFPTQMKWVNLSKSLYGVISAKKHARYIFCLWKLISECNWFNKVFKESWVASICLCMCVYLVGFQNVYGEKWAFSHSCNWIQLKLVYTLSLSFTCWRIIHLHVYDYYINEFKLIWTGKLTRYNIRIMCSHHRHFDRSIVRADCILPFITSIRLSALFSGFVGSFKSSDSREPTFFYERYQMSMGKALTSKHRCQNFHFKWLFILDNWASLFEMEVTHLEFFLTSFHPTK